MARFDLVLDDEPIFARSGRTVGPRSKAISATASERASRHWREAEFYFTGTTSATRDLERVTASDQQLIERLVILAVLAVLLVLLRQPLVCLYLIATVLLTYYVTIGATELVFAWLYGDTFRRTRLESADLLVRDPDRGRRGLQHLPHDARR